MANGGNPAIAAASLATGSREPGHEQEPRCEEFVPKSLDQRSTAHDWHNHIDQTRADGTLPGQVQGFQAACGGGATLF